jgi:hypothetical protein
MRVNEAFGLEALARALGLRAAPDASDERKPAPESPLDRALIERVIMGHDEADAARIDGLSHLVKLTRDAAHASSAFPFGPGIPLVDDQNGKTHSRQERRGGTCNVTTADDEARNEAGK